MPPESPSRQSNETHRCTTCGEDKPVEQFYRWRANRPRSAWYCDDCQLTRDRNFRESNPGYVTAAVRKYRSDPEKAERDRERSRRWKREHLGQPGRKAA